MPKVIKMKIVSSYFFGEGELPTHITSDRRITSIITVLVLTAYLHAVYVGTAANYERAWCDDLGIQILGIYTNPTPGSTMSYPPVAVTHWRIQGGGGQPGHDPKAQEGGPSCHSLKPAAGSTSVVTSCDRKHAWQRLRCKISAGDERRSWSVFIAFHYMTKRRRVIRVSSCARFARSNVSKRQPLVDSEGLRDTIAT